MGDRHCATPRSVPGHLLHGHPGGFYLEGPVAAAWNTVKRDAEATFLVACFWWHAVCWLHSLPCRHSTLLRDGCLTWTMLLDVLYDAFEKRSRCVYETRYLELSGRTGPLPFPFPCSECHRLTSLSRNKGKHSSSSTSVPNTGKRECCT